MNTSIKITNDISYASSAKTKQGRAVIRTIETLTGRNRLLRAVNTQGLSRATGPEFWGGVADKFDLQLDVVGGSLEAIPRNGPLIVVANHPYGILDGLILSNILSQTRGDFRVLANSVFCKSEELNRVVLPVDFDGTKAAIKRNMETRRTAQTYLKNGGAIGVFPGGTVSTAAKPFDHPMDPRWRPFTAKLITKTQATVVPLYFDGANSRLFQVASHLNYTLRMALLINEFRRARKTPVRLVVGEPLDRDELAAYQSNPRVLMDFLRESTYRLSPKPLSSYDYGFEFEDNHR